MSMEKIKYITFENRPAVIATEETQIERIEKDNGMECAEWFRFGKQEFNGKYVVEVCYE